MKQVKKNKNLIWGLSLIAGISYFAADVSSPHQTQVKTPLQKHTSSSRPKDVATTRAPGSQQVITQPPQKTDFDFYKKPMRTSYKGLDLGPALPFGHKLARTIFAVKAAEFTAELGTPIESKNGLIFFSTQDRPQNAINVALDEKNQKLFPISSVLKIKNIDEATRSELLASGLSEHYYHEGLKIMYVKSTHEELLQLQKELQKLQLDVQFEVVRATHQPR